MNQREMNEERKFAMMFLLCLSGITFLIAVGAMIMKSPGVAVIFGAITVLLLVNVVNYGK